MDLHKHRWVHNTRLSVWFQLCRAVNAKIALLLLEFTQIAWRVRNLIFHIDIILALNDNLSQRVLFEFRLE